MLFTCDVRRGCRHLDVQLSWCGAMPGCHAACCTAVTASRRPMPCCLRAVPHNSALLAELMPVAHQGCRHTSSNTASPATLWLQVAALWDELHTKQPWRNAVASSPGAKPIQPFPQEVMFALLRGRGARA